MGGGSRASGRGGSEVGEGGRPDARIAYFFRVYPLQGGPLFKADSILRAAKVAFPCWYQLLTADPTAGP